MSNAYEHTLKLKIKMGDIEIEVAEAGFTYNSVGDQLRKDLDNIVDNALRIIEKGEKDEQ